MKRRETTRKTKLAIAAVVLFSVVGVIAIAGVLRGERPVEVRVEPVEARDLVATVTANGKIQPKRRVEISSDVSGRVVELAVSEGQTVRQGDLLLRIDPTSFEAAVRRQEAAVARARAEVARAHANVLQAEGAWNRNHRLSMEDGLVSVADLEQTETNLAVAQAQHEAATFGVAEAEAALSEVSPALPGLTLPVGRWSDR